jgi:hypothetical protein
MTGVSVISTPGGLRGKRGISWKGTWDPLVSYFAARGDAVFRTDSSYIAIDDSLGADPATTPTKWALLAKGDVTAALAAITAPLATAVTNAGVAGAAAAQTVVDDFNADTSGLLDLPGAGAITGAEMALLSQAGVDVKATLSAIIAALVKAGLTFTGEVDVDLGAAGTLRIKSVSGLLTLGLYLNNTDAQPIISLGSFAGTPLLGFGPGGATAPDTFLTRGSPAEVAGSGSTGAGTMISIPRLVNTVAVTTNRTMQIGDQGKLLEVNQTALRTQTIPPQSSVPLAVKGFVFVAKVGTGDVAITGGAGVTLRDPAGLGNIVTQYETRRLYQRATDDWVMTLGGPA